MSWILISEGQSIGVSASASVLPKNIQGGLPSGLIGMISLQSKGLSRVFCLPQSKEISSLVLNLLCDPTRRVVHDF